MVTKEQAETAQEFHAESCASGTGPRGGVWVSRQVWRRNGRAQTWKTRTAAFRVPVKNGLYRYAYITEQTAEMYHAAEDCPLLKEKS